MEPLVGISSLKVELWPDLDRRARASALAPGDYFTPAGLAAKWSPDTVIRCDKEWGRLLQFQAETGRLRDVSRFGDRIADREDLRALIDWLRLHLSPCSVAGALGHIAQTVRAFDRTADRELLILAWRNLRRSAKPIRKLGVLPTPRELWDAGMAMIEEAETEPDLTDKQRAVLCQNGLIIAFLAVCPLRRRNITALQEEVHLKIENGGNQVQIPAEETKTGAREIVAGLPAPLVAAIHRYWTHHRKALAIRPDTDATALWLTTRGTVMSAEVLSWRIKSVLRARLEIDFTTHMFRHAAATFIADVAPQLAMMIIGVLGHTDITMAEKHYIRGQQKRALTMYQDEILAIIEAAGELGA